MHTFKIAIIYVGVYITLQKNHERILRNSLNMIKIVSSGLIDIYFKPFLYDDYYWTCTVYLTGKLAALYTKEGISCLYCITTCLYPYLHGKNTTNV